MTGLTLNTGAATTARPAPSQDGGATAGPSRQAANAPQQQAAPPTLPPAEPSSRSSSPARPTYSPITPPLNPTSLPPAAAAPLPPPAATTRYTHSTQTTQTAMAAPPAPPEPVDFESNPDVLALKSAISILQMQRRRAQADMAALDRAKRAALADPEAFVRDLTAGRVGVEGDPLFVGGVRASASASGTADAAADDSSSSGSSSSSDGSDDSDVEMSDVGGNGDGDVGSSSAQANGEMDGSASGSEAAQPTRIPTSIDGAAGDGDTDAQTASRPRIKTEADAAVVGDGGPRPWTTLPRPQSVVRCPPINWSQYAVVGDSLDRIHNDQLSRPAQGVPAVMIADGRFEHKGDGVGKQEKLVGIAAPYTPGRDRLDKKPKGPKR
ncbi:hypothetical protein F4779DRAFT_619045 [Xylariaceae sp. FL0662B]|nr:hypothetical protein F4779DRAFT_619045 [Xylariaceae sp. FL0662B]